MLGVLWWRTFKISGQGNASLFTHTVLLLYKTSTWISGCSFLRQPGVRWVPDSHLEVLSHGFTLATNFIYLWSTLPNPLSSRMCDGTRDNPQAAGSAAPPWLIPFTQQAGDTVASLVPTGWSVAAVWWPLQWSLLSWASEPKSWQKNIKHSLCKFFILFLLAWIKNVFTTVITTITTSS